MFADFSLLTPDQATLNTFFSYRYPLDFIEPVYDRPDHEKLLAISSTLRPHIVEFLRNTAGDRFAPFIDAITAPVYPSVQAFFTDLVINVDGDMAKPAQTFAPYAASCRNALAALADPTLQAQDRGFAAISSFAHSLGCYYAYAIPFRPFIDGKTFVCTTDTDMLRASALYRAVDAQRAFDAEGAQILDGVLRALPEANASFDFRLSMDANTQKRVAEIKEIAARANLWTQALWIASTRKLQCLRV